MERIKKVVDQALAEMSKNDAFMTTPGKIPSEMLDQSRPQSDDWRGWKPIDSIITDDDINALEMAIGVKLPLSYRQYLNISISSVLYSQTAQ